MSGKTLVVVGVLVALVGFFGMENYWVGAAGIGIVLYSIFG